MNDDALMPLIDQMLACRKEACEKINKLFGLNIDVELNSAWLKIAKEVVNEVEKEEAEVKKAEAEAETIEKTNEAIDENVSEDNKAEETEEGGDNGGTKEDK